LTLDITSFLQPSAKRGHKMRKSIVSGDLISRKPIIGIAACYARATSGHVAAAAPPKHRDELAAPHEVPLILWRPEPPASVPRFAGRQKAPSQS